MTVREALSRYEKGQVVASSGDSLKSICFRVYNSIEDAYLRPFALLNLRYDILNLEPGSTLITLPENVLLQIEEL